MHISEIIIHVTVAETYHTEAYKRSGAHRTFNTGLEHAIECSDKRAKVVDRPTAALDNMSCANLSHCEVVTMTRQTRCRKTGSFSARITGAQLLRRPIGGVLSSIHTCSRSAPG
jgi:hypothetical protein